MKEIRLINELEEFFKTAKLPKIFQMCSGVAWTEDVPKYIELTFQRLRSNQIEYLDKIDIEDLLKLKNEILNPTNEFPDDGLYFIRTSTNFKNCFKLPFKEYERLRNKIRERILSYYDSATCNDADQRSYELSFCCKLIGHECLQIFNVEDWISFEIQGIFDMEWNKRLIDIQSQSGHAKVRPNNWKFSNQFLKNNPPHY